MVHMSRSRIASGPVHTHTASATDSSALAMLQRLAMGSGDGWRRLVVDLSTPLDPIHEICGRALGRRWRSFTFWPDHRWGGRRPRATGLTTSLLRCGLMPEAGAGGSRFDPAVKAPLGWMPFGRRGWILRDCSWKRMKGATGWWIPAARGAS